MSPNEARLVRDTSLTIVALVALRLVGAAWTPLTFDEAYYWTWSQHLSPGYYDHPPGVAFVIRLGTLIAGNTELGVRMVSILLALPMSFAVYRTAAILFPGPHLAADATILFNITLMAAVGTLIVTPDSPLLVASSFVLFFLAKVLQTNRGVWWLAVGAAVGAALLSKYTALFFGPAILIWLLSVAKLRRWLISPWPYLGGVVAIAIFSPVIVWNAEHRWVSFVKQIGRSRIAELNFAFIGELIPTQVAFATPLVFILGAMGLYALSRRDSGALAARALINAVFWTIVAYFFWHSLHARVEANWFAPVYPAFAIAAAVAAHLTWQARAQRVVDFCLRWAPPTGVLMFVLLLVQANTGMLTGFRRDATVRSVGVGWTQLASQIEAVRARSGATCVLAPDYGTTSWLAFYLPKDVCVVQPVQRIRWVNMGEVDAAKLSGKLLFVDELRSVTQPYVKDTFEKVERVAEFRRMRGPLVIETYGIDLLDGAKKPVLDNSPPPELQ
jgi:4-amino-4-deoxy-L-arabinose transferase-like glycosyltransferase